MSDQKFARRTIARLLNINERSVIGLAEACGTPVMRSETGVKARLYSMQNLFDIAAHVREKSGLPKQKLRVLTTNIPRGGTGKTFISTNLAVSFALLGYKTALIDLDFQSSATMLFGYNSDVTTDTAADWGVDPALAVDYHFGHMMGLGGSTKVSFDRIAKHPYGPNGPTLVPADESLTRLENELMLERLQNPKSDFKIAQVLEQDPAFADFEIIIVDTGPGYTRITNSAMLASAAVLAPIGLDRVSDKGLRILSSELEQMRANYGFAPAMRIIPNMLVNTQRSLKMINWISERYAGLLEHVHIPRAEEVVKSYSAGEGEKMYPFILSYPSSPISDSLRNLAAMLSTSLWGSN